MSKIYLLPITCSCIYIFRDKHIHGQSQELWSCCLQDQSFLNWTQLPARWPEWRLIPHGHAHEGIRKCSFNGFEMYHPTMSCPSKVTQICKVWPKYEETNILGFCWWECKQQATLIRPYYRPGPLHRSFSTSVLLTFGIGSLFVAGEACLAASLGSSIQMLVLPHLGWTTENISRHCRVSAEG